MKQRILFLLTASLLSIACSIEESNVVSHEMQISDELLTNPSLVYHSDLNMYLQKTSEDILTKTTLNKDDATHLTIKFYPNSIEQQMFLANEQSASISYIPFGYEPVTNILETKSPIANYPEKNPHKIKYDGPVYIDRIDGSTGAELQSIEREVSLPIMYAYWPINEQLPDEIDYNIVDTVAILNDNTTITMMGFPLRLTTYDSLLGTEVPLRNIKVRSTFNSISSDRYTDSNGFILVSPRILDISETEISNGTITLILESNNWTITSGNTSTTPIHIPLGRVGRLWFPINNPSQINHSLSSNANEIETHRAIDYYFNSEHALSDGITSYDSGIIIHIMPISSEGYLGLARPSIKEIEIYNSGYPQRNIISTVFHEQGHIRHYGKINSFSQTTSFVKESYASFIGWSIGEEYYTSKGYIKSSPSYQINHQGRQTWTIDSGLYEYSPLFVDLNDEYNQSTLNSNYVNDNISNIPHSIIETIAIESQNMVDCFNNIEEFVDIYFTQENFNLMREYYE